MSKATEFDSPLKRAAGRGEIGARRAGPEPDATPVERQDVRTLQRQDVRTLQRQNAMITEDTADDKEEMKRQTVYLPKSLAAWLKVHAATRDEDMSGIIARLVEQYRAAQG